MIKCVIRGSHFNYKFRPIRDTEQHLVEPLGKEILLILGFGHEMEFQKYGRESTQS